MKILFMDDNKRLEELVKRAQQYDTEAFGEIYDLFYKKIYSFVYFKVGKRFEAEDITEQVFLKALENIQAFEWRGVPLSAWLFRIAGNLVIDYYRVAGREIADLDDSTNIELTGGVCPEAAALREMQRQELIEAMRGLTDEQQQVVVLRFIAGLSNEEVARILEKNVGAIKALQHRAISTLGRVMGAVYDEA